MSYNQFIGKFGNCVNFVEFYGLLKAIPKTWIDLLGTELNSLDPKELQFELEYKRISRTHTKEAYNRSVRDNGKIIKTLHKKWKSKMEKLEDRPISIIELEKCFLELYWISPNQKHRSFQFRLLHRRIFLNDMLYRWKLADTALCEYCHTDYQTIEHFFVECPKVKPFWAKFQGWFECLTDSEITLSPRRILLNNFEGVCAAPFLNAALLIAKYHLYVNFCLDKEFNFYNFKDELTNIIRYERIDALNKNSRRKFCKKWAPMLK